MFLKEFILLSRIFKTSYKNKDSFLGIVKFNLLTKIINVGTTALGGINFDNLNKVKKINVITGKGMRSKNLDDPYQSSDLSILKHSVPEFIKNNSELMKKIMFSKPKPPSVMWRKLCHWKNPICWSWAGEQIP